MYSKLVVFEKPSQHAPANIEYVRRHLNALQVIKRYDMGYRMIDTRMLHGTPCCYHAEYNNGF